MNSATTRGLRLVTAWRVALLILVAITPLAQATAARAEGLSAQEAVFRQTLAEASAENEAILSFYRARNYAPLWTSAGQTGNRAALLSAVAVAGDHGLPPARYGGEALRQALGAVVSERDRARLELRMTETFLRFARDLHGGLLDPQRTISSIKRQAPSVEVEELLARLDREEPAALLRSLMPAAPEYGRLLRARRQMETAIERGGWGAPVTAETLRPGDKGEAVIALRDRLMAMGFLDRSASASYDAALQVAVQRFQLRHGLTPDGIAGRATLRELNIGPEARLGQILVALERERWMNIPRGDRHIWVNLADFRTQIVDSGEPTFDTISIVGERRSELQTPEFSEMMTYMEINPDWTIPRGILGRSYLPGLQANPHAYAQFQVIDARGRVVDRSRVNFASYSAGSLPFSLRQPPGPSNPLGKVKFMFPNPWAIYLHDTPTQSLFNTQSRAHSNGCVRLKDPDGFAHALLAPQSEDPKAEFDRIHASGRQTRVPLEQPVPVHLVYRTAFTTPTGELHFREDVYGRDALILEALLAAGVEMPGLSG